MTTDAALNAVRTPARHGKAALVLPIIAVAVPLSQATTKIVDSAQIRRDSSGELYWHSTGALGHALLIAILLIAGALAVLHLIEMQGISLPRISSPSSWLLCLYCLSMLVGLFRGIGAEKIATGLSGFVILLAVINRPVTRSSLRVLAIINLCGMMTVVSYGVAFPESAHLPCRVDKCGLFNGLFVGYFAHENLLAFYACLSIPLFVFLRSRAMSLGGALLGLACVLAAGSRASYLMAAVSLAVFWVLRRPGDLRRKLSVFVGLLPLLGFAVSLTSFLTVSDMQLTGRGQIWEIVRASLQGYAIIFGSGGDVLSDAYEMYRAIGYRVSHEHGQAPHLLARTGIVGTLLFLIALIMAGRAQGGTGTRNTVPAQLGIGLLAVSGAGFATESMIKVEATDTLFFFLVLVVACFARTQLVVSQSDVHK